MEPRRGDTKKLPSTSGKNVSPWSAGSLLPLFLVPAYRRVSMLRGTRRFLSLVGVAGFYFPGSKLPYTKRRQAARTPKNLDNRIPIGYFLSIYIKDQAQSCL